VRGFAVSAGALVVMIAVPAEARAQAAPAKADTAPAPSPAPTPSPAPPRLRLDVDRHVEDVLRRNQESGLPRFEDRIEVTEREQEALEALLRGAELACSPSSSGPPPTSELNRFKTAPIPPYVDFVAAAKAILKGLKRINPWKGAPRWILYGVHQGDAVRLVLREGEIQASVRLSVPGTTWEELARFHDRGEATTALRRLERGFETMARRTPGEPPHPYVSIKCLPPGFR
jgi:hypothetical protein